MIAVDVFSGAGGLSEGLKGAEFRIGAAIEIDPVAVDTYKANHPEVVIFRQDVKTVRGTDILGVLQARPIDLMASCPPCQGFSTLSGRREGDDPRNELVHEVSRLARELKPRMLMMENVPGLLTRGKPLFDELVAGLLDLKYKLVWSTLQVADYGVPQMRRRLVLFGARGFAPQLPDPTHDRLGRGGRMQWRTVRDAIPAGIGRPVPLPTARRSGGPQSHNWHVVREISDLNRKRLKDARPGHGWETLPKELRVKCHQEAPAGYFSNVYGRMAWNRPGPTITAGCTNPGMGRFGHPSQLRTISVREAALLQTFPEDYIFDTDLIGRATSMIGNALPCTFAEALAASCKSQLKRAG